MPPSAATTAPPTTTRHPPLPADASPSLNFPAKEAALSWGRQARPLRLFKALRKRGARRKERAKLRRPQCRHIGGKRRGETISRSPPIEPTSPAPAGRASARRARAPRLRQPPRCAAPRCAAPRLRQRAPRQRGERAPEGREPHSASNASPD